MIYLILIFAIILRLPLLNGSFWLDEAAQFLESARSLTEQLSIKDDFQPPLMHLLTFFSIRLGNIFGLGRTEWWLRLIPSFIPGILTIWATYQIGLKFFNRKAALLASLFLATSSFHIFYSQELRPYSLPALWGIMATWQMLEMIKNDKKKPSFLFGIFSVLGIYSSYLYPFLLVAQLAYLIRNKFKLKKAILLSVFIGLSFLPWLPKFLEQLQAGQSLRLSMPGWDKVVSLPQLKTAALIPLKFIFGVSDLQNNLAYVFLALIIFVPFIYFVYLLIKKRNKQLSFFLYLLALPLLASWLISFFVPVLQAKRVLYLLPVFALLEAYLITTYQKIHPHLSKIFLSSILIINIFSTLAYWKKPNLQRENWRSLTKEIENKFPKAETAILFSFNAPFAPWVFYEKNEIKTFNTGGFYVNNLDDPAQLLKELSNYRYVLVFDYLRDLTDPDDILLKTVKDLGFSEAGVLDYSNIGFVRIYSLNNLALKK